MPAYVLVCSFVRAYVRACTRGSWQKDREAEEETLRGCDAQRKREKQTDIGRAGGERENGTAGNKERDRDRDRERQRETERDRQRQTQRQRHRERQRHTDRQGDTQTDRDREVAYRAGNMLAGSAIVMIKISRAQEPCESRSGP